MNQYLSQPNQQHHHHHHHQLVPAKRPAESTLTSQDPARSSSGAISTKRSHVACLRCRSQKLKCDGTFPCSRCVKFKLVCKEPISHRAISAAAATPSYVQHDRHLNRTHHPIVDNLYSAAPAPPQFTNHHHHHHPHQHDPNHPQQQLQQQHHQHVQMQGHLTDLVERLSSTVSKLVRSDDDDDDESTSNRQPQSDPSDRLTSHTSQKLANQRSGGADPVRVAAPFSDVVFDSSACENRQITRANTPDSAEQSFTFDKQSRPDPSHSDVDRLQVATGTSPAAMGEDRLGNSSRGRGSAVPSILRWSYADPVGEGIVSMARAQYLLEFFLRNCHVFLPLLATQPAPKAETLRKTDPFLLSAILAIASGFCFGTETSGAGSEIEAERLCELAEAQLATTLIRTRYRLGDVQAVVLLHAWGLRPGGGSADTWILSGHAFRLAKRLSIDKTVWPNGEQNRPSAARRTWLLLCASDCFPSLGFGRPASPKENLDACANVIASLREDLFVHGKDLGMDTFVAAQAELAQVSRQLLDWVNEATSYFGSPSPRNPSGSGHTNSWRDRTVIWEKYKHINGQLEICHDRWDSPLMKDPAQRKCAALYRWHVRLCLPMLALRLSQVAFQMSVEEEASKQDLANNRQQPGPRLGSTTLAAEAAASKDRIASEEDRKDGSSPGTGDDSGSRLSSAYEKFHRSYRRAAAEASEAIIHLHDSDHGALTFVPDYLITALAQAAIAFIGLAEAEPTDGLEHDHCRTSVKRNVGLALSSLEKMNVGRTGLAKFLSVKVREAAKKAAVVAMEDLDEPEWDGSTTVATSHQAPFETSSAHAEAVGTLSLMATGVGSSGLADQDARTNPSSSSYRQDAAVANRHHASGDTATERGAVLSIDGRNHRARFEEDASRQFPPHPESHQQGQASGAGTWASASTSTGSLPRPDRTENERVWFDELLDRPRSEFGGSDVTLSNWDWSKADELDKFWESQDPLRFLFGAQGTDSLEVVGNGISVGGGGGGGGVVYEGIGGNSGGGGDRSGGYGADGPPPQQHHHQHHAPQNFWDA
ncbi:hypothetical protein IE53DRAFT_362755 [Violaceomyces palustris]|uniref:Uncharacterized protein n=1 Tax=Violaceomyces palustris TaxID=1673888 RepID=A0ACD0NVU1_9BASI|nr:hypothetical protein IE53DRAFT_362755 [Violaceomyces palustris]